MSKVLFELNTKGVGQLLKSSEMRDVVEKAAQGVAARAMGSYDVKTVMAGTRVIAAVETADKDTYKENLETNTLLRALGG